MDAEVVSSTMRIPRPHMLRSILLTTCCLVALSCFTAVPGAAAATLGCADDASGTTDLSSWTGVMLDATNAHRTSMGLVALRLDPTLTKASVWKARDMARRNYFTHDDPALGSAPQRTPWERLDACGWTSGGTRAENIAAGQRSGAAFIESWLNSPGHRANIEKASMRYVGFGIASSSSSRYSTYAVQMFASVAGPVAPPPVTPPPVTPPPVTPPPVTPPPVTPPPVTPPPVTPPPVTPPPVTPPPVTPPLTKPPVSVPPVTKTPTEKTPDTPADADPDDTQPGDGPAATTFVSVTSRVTQRRCRSRAAVAGWCYTLTTRGTLVNADGSAATGRRVSLRRRAASGRWVTVGTARTSASGRFTSTRTIRPARRALATWLRRNASHVRVTWAGDEAADGTGRQVTVRQATIRRSRS
ncbi:MAG: putative stress protein [Thermoleophilia bacterium]|nr:putative stress protein [Thermoleophilia bacterium]